MIFRHLLNMQSQSHPTWVRGLKLDYTRIETHSKSRSRTLRGCVD